MIDLVDMVYAMVNKKCLLKDNWRILNVWVFDNQQTTVHSFSEALYYLHVEFMANLDHYNSIELET